MTSSNVTHFTIYEKSSGKECGKHSQSHYCKTHWEDLLKYDPSENYMILPWWEDEEEEYHEGRIENLKDFLIEVLKIKTD